MHIVSCIKRNKERRHAIDLDNDTLSDTLKFLTRLEIEACELVNRNIHALIRRIEKALPLRSISYVGLYRIPRTVQSVLSMRSLDLGEKMIVSFFIHNSTPQNYYLHYVLGRKDTHGKEFYEWEEIELLFQRFASKDLNLPKNFTEHARTLEYASLNLDKSLLRSLNKTMYSVGLMGKG